MVGLEIFGVWVGRREWEKSIRMGLGVEKGIKCGIVVGVVIGIGCLEGVVGRVLGLGRFIGVL